MFDPDAENLFRRRVDPVILKLVRISQPFQKRSVDQRLPALVFMQMS
jgi:hypothetical protein